LAGANTSISSWAKSGRLRRVHPASPDPLDLAICERCAPQPIVAISGFMETYRIIPLGHAYRVEAVQPNGQTRVVRTWPTEEAAISHLNALREVAERFAVALQPGERDWRG
jgi:hypothetical protein